MSTVRRTPTRPLMSLLRASLVICFLLATALARPQSARADIVFSTGGPGGGSPIYAMSDSGDEVRTLVSGNFQKPFVAPDGTVVFTDAYSVVFPSGDVWAYREGSTRLLASDFSGAADDAEVGYGGRYLFKNIVKYEKDVLREGNIASGTTTPLDLCHQTYPFESDPGHYGLDGYWKAETDEPGMPALNPARDEFVYSGCGWRRHWSDETEGAYEEVPGLFLVTAGGEQEWILKGENDWSIDDASWSPDGNSLVLVYWRGYDSGSTSKIGIEREAVEGIYVSNADGTEPHQVLTLGGGRRQNVMSPRFTGDGRIVFGFNDWIDSARNGIYSIPASCSPCTMASATLLQAGGSYVAWTPLHIAAPPASGGGPGAGGGGPAPGPPPPPPAQQVEAARFMLSSGARAKTATASRSGSFGVPGLKLVCAAGGAGCTVSASAATTVAASFKATSSAATKKKTRTLALASRSFPLASGKTSGLTLKLSKRGRAALRRLRQTRVTVTITVTKPGAKTVRRTVSMLLKAPR